ncbi:glycosyltransferase family 39 protein [Planococcus sp. APC 4015]|nr:glycosyltransferase family 39 protein [Planococcus sp. APC 4015]
MTDASSSLATRRRTWATAATLFVAATVLAAAMSPSVSLWTDEAVTVSAAERSLPELWALLQRIDAVHALYYAFMSVWIDVFGASPFSLRLPSALAAGGTALGAYMLTRRLATDGTALAAGIVAATLPRLAWGGIEARPFIFSALAAVWASYLLVRALRGDRGWVWVAYSAVAAVGVLVNIYLVMLVVAHAITVIVLARRERTTLLRFFAAAAAAALVSSPLLLLVRSQQAQLGTAGDRSPLSILRKILVNQFFLGETPDSEVGPLWFARAWQGAAIVAAAIGIALMIVAIVRRSAPGDDKRAILALTLPWIVLPTALVAAYAVAASPIYQPRYFTFTAPAAAILIALGLRALGRRWITVATVTVYALCIVVVLTSQRTPFAKGGSDWSAVADVISAESADGDAVYFAPRYPERETINQTTRRIAQAYPGAFDGLNDITIDQTGAETGSLDGLSRPLADAVEDLRGTDRVWVVLSVRSLPDTRDESSELLEQAGFTARVAWDGPSTVVLEYTRG